MEYKFAKPKEIIFLGYHDVVLDYLKINKKYKVKTTILVSSNQKRKIKLNQIKILAFSKQNKNFFSRIKQICSTKTDKLFISVSWPWIINRDILKNLFSKETLINVHHSRLPYDAGRATTSWKILRNDRINSTVIHFINDKLDNGDIIFRRDSLFSKKSKIPIEIDKEINHQSINMYKDFMQKIFDNTKFRISSQPNLIGRYNMRLDTKLNAWVDWKWSSEQIYRFINAFEDPYEGAKTTINNKEVRLKAVQIHGGESQNHPFMSGQILRNDRKWLLVATSDHNCLLIEKVLNAKGKNIISDLREGNTFFTQLTKLNLSKKRSSINF